MRESSSPVTRVDPTLQQKVDFLSDRRTYRGQTGAIRCVETHFAWVFLTKRHAYKLKKPLRQLRMDYRSVAARKRGCLEEVRLNRRLAPSIYLGAVPLTVVGGGLSLGGRGRVVDWLVKMRRLPDARLLDRALAAHAVADEEIDAVVRVLARFYQRAARHPVSRSRYVERLTRHVKANRLAIRERGRRLPQSLAQEVCEIQLRAIHHLGAELGARGACVVEGHGDLRAEHVYLGPPIAIIDSLEFDRALRVLDPADEVSLLALEIERLGHAKLAARLLSQFRAVCEKPPTPAVAAFYMSHRAGTRAKLAAWHVGDPQFPDARPWISRARSLLDDARRYARLALSLPCDPRAYRGRRSAASAEAAESTARRRQYVRPRRKEAAPRAAR